jgi:hypothetical protein
LDDWIYCTLYIHTVRDYRSLQRYRYSTHFQFTVAHALGFFVFTSRILATDLSQSHCLLGTVLPFLNHLQLSSPELDPILLRLLFRTPCYSASTSPVLPNTADNHFSRTPRKTPSFVVRNACLLVRYLTMDVLLLSRARVLREYTDPLPSNGYTRHSITIYFTEIGGKV